MNNLKDLLKSNTIFSVDASNGRIRIQCKGSLEEIMFLIVAACRRDQRICNLLRASTDAFKDPKFMAIYEMFMKMEGEEIIDFKSTLN